jgi:hypothetical protein
MKTNQSTKINLIGCDTIVNSPSKYLNEADFNGRRPQKTKNGISQQPLIGILQVIKMKTTSN